MDEFVTTPEEEKRLETERRRGLRKLNNFDPSTRHPSLSEQKKFDRELVKDVLRHKGLLDGPTH